MSLPVVEEYQKDAGIITLFSTVFTVSCTVVVLVDFFGSLLQDAIVIAARNRIRNEYFIIVVDY